MKETKQKYFFDILLSVSFFAVIFIMAITTLISKDKTFSDTENRNLAQFPKFTLSSYLDRSFMKDFGDYQNDQLVGRDVWVKLKTKTDITLGRKELNHVYKGSNGALFEPFEPLDKKTRQVTLDAMNAFATAHQDKRFDMMLIPNAMAIQKDQLPSNIPDPDQLKMMNETKLGLPTFHWIDTVTPLNKHKDEYLYYRSDHHWTSLAASYAFSSYATSRELDTSAHPFQSYLISDQFYGTLASRSSYYSGDPDEINMYVSTNGDDTYTVSYVEEKQKSATIFQADKLKTRDQYAVFFGGNHPLIEINTTSSIDKKLLVFKDSYANCFLPFLTPYYSRIVVVDPRYYAGDINQLMSDQEISDVLFLYNANTFYQDTSIDVLLGNK